MDKSKKEDCVSGRVLSKTSRGTFLSLITLEGFLTKGTNTKCKDDNKGKASIVLRLADIRHLVGRHL